MHSKDQIPPSYFVRSTRVYKQWCNITICKSCGCVGKYEDQHPVNPCMMCGNKKFSEEVGRWVRESPWWKFWEERGFWEVKT